MKNVIAGHFGKKKDKNYFVNVIMLFPKSDSPLQFDLNPLR